MDKLTTAVRKARWVGVLNKIAGIKEPGLREAKNLFELITGSWSHISATNIGALWCVVDQVRRVKSGQQPWH